MVPIPEWSDLKREFAAVAELPTAEQSRYLEDLRERSPTLADEVVSLLDHHKDDDTLLAHSSGGRREDATTVPVGPRGESGDGAPRFLGRYRIGKELGRGGMGRVYRGQRQDDFEKHVAIKLLPERAGPALLHRMLEERQILARLEHPNIARLIDGGSDDLGRPFLVMELVEGEPIDSFCRRRAIDVRGRVELVVQVCRAVHAAHQQLIVHRDLKCSNVLVTEDGDPEAPRLWHRQASQRRPVSTGRPDPPPSRSNDPGGRESGTVPWRAGFDSHRYLQPRHSDISPVGGSVTLR